MTRTTPKSGIKIDGETYDRETLAEAIDDVRAGRMPVALMDETALRDGIENRLLWIIAALTGIAAQEADDAITDAADAALVHAEQARDMWAALGDDTGE